MVLDASALIELLLGSEKGQRLALMVEKPAEALHVPHVVDLEVAQALRRYRRQGMVTPEAAGEVLGRMHVLALRRHAHEPLLDDIWSLRDNFSAYDAAYVALALVLDAPLLTCDGRLARVPRPAKARIVLVQ